MAVGSEAFTAALAFYNTSKRAAKDGVPGAEEVASALKVRFEQAKAKDDARKRPLGNKALPGQTYATSDVGGRLPKWGGPLRSRDDAAFGSVIAMFDRVIPLWQRVIASANRVIP